MSASESACAAYDATVERNFRRNVTAFAGWEFVWGLGMPFAMFATFAPMYLDALGAPKTLIGFVLALPALFSAGQIVTGYIVPSHRRLTVYRAAVISCLVPWLAYAVASFFWGRGWPEPVHYYLFAGVQVLFVGVVNGGGSLYWEMMTDNIPPRRRGRLFGYRAAASGVAGLATGYLAARVLAHWERPVNLQLCFIIGVGVYVLSCGMLWVVRDQVNPAHSADSGDERPPFWRYLRETLRRVWLDPNYRIFLFFMALLSVAMAGAPFMVAAARASLDISSQGQGAFALVYLGTVAALGWAVGALADRYGYRLIGGLSGALLATAYVLCLTTHSLFYWYVAYGCFALVSFSSGMLLCNMSAELFPSIQPRMLLALGNLLLVASVLPATTLSGALVDRVHSYTPLFIANAVLSVVAVFGFALIVREPRDGDLLIVKMTPKG